MLKTLNLGSALLAGVVVTGIMTLLMYTAPLLGLPPMDILRALGSLLPWQTSPYIPGVLLHLGIGSLLALLYALFFAPLFPGPRWARGALYSFLPWLLAIYAMGPMMTLVQSWTTPAEASQAMNPCALVNPCGAGLRPANPCAVRPAAGNPGRAGSPQAMNPCAPRTPQAMNPCGSVTDPGQGAPSQVVTRLMSLMAHLAFGVTLGLLYRPKADPGEESFSVVKKRSPSDAIQV